MRLSFTGVRILILGVLWMVAIAYSYWWTYQGAPEDVGFPFGPLVIALISVWHFVRTWMSIGGTSQDQLEKMDGGTKFHLWVMAPVMIFFSAAMLPDLATNRLQHKVEWAAQRNLNNLDYVAAGMVDYIRSTLDQDDRKKRISQRMTAMLSARPDLSHIVLHLDGEFSYNYSMASQKMEIAQELLDLGVARFLPDDLEFTGDAHRDTFHGVAHNVTDGEGSHRGVLIVAMDLTDVLAESRKRVNSLLVMSVVFFLAIGVFGVWTLLNLILSVSRRQIS